MLKNKIFYLLLHRSSPCRPKAHLPGVILVSVFQNVSPSDASNYGWSLPLTPTSTSQVTLQSLTQWNNIWKLEPTAVSTALSRPSVKNDTLGRTYDLSGRVTSSVQHGVVIDAAGQKHIR